MNTQLEKLQILLEKNKEWEDNYPTTPGDKNPFPTKIENTFVKYYNKYYKAIISYETKEKGKCKFEAEKHEIENSLYHAWFTCTTIEECFNTIEYWIKDYWESYLIDEGLTLINKIEVESIERK